MGNPKVRILDASEAVMIPLHGMDGLGNMATSARVMTSRTHFQ